MKPRHASQVMRYLASGLTLWSFIKYRLYIHSPQHARRVRDRIKTRINALAREGKVQPIRSVRGRRSYAWRIHDGLENRSG